MTLPDLETLVALYAKDPQVYEVMRSHLLQECVITAPDQYQPMLDDLVWQIEQARATATSPLKAAAIATSLLTNNSLKMTELTSKFMESKSIVRW